MRTKLVFDGATKLVTVAPASRSNVERPFGSTRRTAIRLCELVRPNQSPASMTQHQSRQQQHWQRMLTMLG